MCLVAGYVLLTVAIVLQNRSYVCFNVLVTYGQLDMQTALTLSVSFKQLSCDPFGYNGAVLPCTPNNCCTAAAPTFALKLNVEAPNRYRSTQHPSTFMQDNILEDIRSGITGGVTQDAFKGMEDAYQTAKEKTANLRSGDEAAGGPAKMAAG